LRIAFHLLMPATAFQLENKTIHSTETSMPMRFGCHRGNVDAASTHVLGNKDLKRFDRWSRYRCDAKIPRRVLARWGETLRRPIARAKRGRRSDSSGRWL